jgi:hypothetical protein
VHVLQENEKGRHFQRILEVYSSLIAYEIRGTVYDCLRVFAVVSRCLLDDKELQTLNLALLAEMIKPQPRMYDTGDTGGIVSYIDM